jgi:2-polyprenyl-3-methyl-5-hydroxy-6-metoxy-1,4-benzoquinol methylase
MKPELETLKSRLRSTWIAGDFGQIARSYAPGASAFIERLHIEPGSTVLDVACGTGNLALPAARVGAIVAGIDIAPNLIDQARENAVNEGLSVRFEEGDAEALPYADASFDSVVTMFGAMFAPRPDLVAAELKRVCKPGGTIAMANWTPTGMIGSMFKIVSGYVPPPAGMTSPVQWGLPEIVAERFKDGVSELKTTSRMMTFNFSIGPAEVVEHFRLYYGPTQKAFDSLDETNQAKLRADLEQLWSEHNKATDGTTSADSKYLEVLARRQ